jgi:23S rRNA pseudoU1915 N3-methylase RlmH
MGNSQSMQKVNFEDIQFTIKNKENHILINTLNENEQDCLIINTVKAANEETIINQLLKNGNKSIKIIVYGKNGNDEKIYKKYNQLISLGFYNVYLYIGGMFEWLLLQEVFDKINFQTDGFIKDIVDYKIE